MIITIDTNFIMLVIKIMMKNGGHIYNGNDCSDNREIDDNYSIAKVDNNYNDNGDVDNILVHELLW